MRCRRYNDGFDLCGSRLAVPCNIFRNGNERGMGSSLGAVEAQTLDDAISKANNHLAQQAAAPHAIEEP